MQTQYTPNGKRNGGDLTAPSSSFRNSSGHSVWVSRGIDRMESRWCCCCWSEMELLPYFDAALHAHCRSGQQPKLVPKDGPMELPPAARYNHRMAATALGTRHKYLGLASFTFTASTHCYGESDHTLRQINCKQWEAVTLPEKLRLINKGFAFE